MSPKLLTSTWMYAVSKKNKRSKQKDLSRIERNAKKLNDILPNSEVWFRKLYDKEKLHSSKLSSHFRDKFNYPLGCYIPDVINQGYKYIIEIDGSIHNTTEQQFRDKEKDLYYITRGYKVYRIKAYSLDSYLTFVQELKQYLLEHYKTQSI